MIDVDPDVLETVVDVGDVGEELVVMIIAVIEAVEVVDALVVVAAAVPLPPVGVPAASWKINVEVLQQAVFASMPVHLR